MEVFVMNANEFKDLYNQYNPIFEPIINKMIKDDFKYLMINEKIKWCFGFDENATIMGACNRKTNVITLNILSLIHAYKNQLMIDVEYFLVHEMRHIFQHLEIKEFKHGNETVVDKDIIEKWIYESRNYVVALDSNGKENEEYFRQDSEMDAYAFSFAFMKYKYGKEKIENLYLPKAYEEDFFSIVNDFIEFFKSIG